MSLNPFYLTLTLTLLAVTSRVTWCQCIPEDNCKSPACRCWDDATTPGAIAAIDIPQMVLISFGYSVNRGNSDMYTSLFEGIDNPNSCPGRGTFFVQKVNTDPMEIKRLYDDGHEIGVTTRDGTTPTSPQDWKDSLTEAKESVVSAGVPQQEVQGFRSPELRVGSDDQFEAMADIDLLYDSSCVSGKFISRETLLWPYTYDFVDDTPVCTTGSDPEMTFKGTWQFLIADLKLNDTLCATPSSCSGFVKNEQEVFDFLYASFLKHYDEKRTPFILYIDPLWLTVQYQFDGTRQFLQFIQSGFDDTWLITNRQALQWIQDPVPTANITNFTPWQCT